TPIQEENVKNLNTTATVFGDELHRYSIADGIRDKNVLGFDPYKVLTYRDRDLRQAVALEQAKARTVAEALEDPKKAEVFNRFMREIPMAGYHNDSGKYIKGIEDYLPANQYEREQHYDSVVEDILSNWMVLSQNKKFHALFATHSIPDAILYYRLFKTVKPSLKITALFEPTIDNVGDGAYKEEGLVEIIEDYNFRYDKSYTL